MDFDDDIGLEDSVLIPQQVPTRNLTEAFVRAGGDLRFQTAVSSIAGANTEHPRVTCVAENGTPYTINCGIVTGADGYHGISRTSIPEGVQTCYAHEYDYAWLPLLVEVATNSLDTAIHSRGFSASIPRGTRASRIYLQVPLDDDLNLWPDNRIWSKSMLALAFPERAAPFSKGRSSHCAASCRRPCSTGDSTYLATRPTSSLR